MLTAAASTDLNTVEYVVFGVIAASMAIAAIRVVTAKNIVHAALYLVVVLAGVAALYVMLAAEFIAVVQVLVYIGAIVVLLLFGTMLTRAPIGTTSDLDNEQRGVSLVVSLFLLGVLGWTLTKAFGWSHMPETPVQRTADVGNSIFQSFVIPFEVVSILLLAALVGAVVIARRD
ncbi:MAG: NADH-quinone oxidoreductase subunit [Acidimicrobiaceae bacterium]|nr:NADH-quinone oxidoreductase subunit [Acidimicrobiaceae bacterium]MDQ1445826.1 NADH-quinone oxidoreductase subunit [Acidimicrobiaceae bacterium]